MIWANLLHLSYNMWWDREAPELEGYVSTISAKPYLRFEKSLWDDLLVKMADAGMNMVVIDLGDAVRYASHPEIAVEGAWSVEQLREELAKMRAMGLEPIPKLNFSACHDAWLGPYSRMLSTPAYYKVCGDLIEEVCDIFDKPRFFHLGMDEENIGNQRHHLYVVIRQYELWWHDLMFYVDHVEKSGVRAWVWSDYLWDHPDRFVERMPKSVLQSNWYYGAEFEPTQEPTTTYVNSYVELEKHGYDQIPTGSNWSSKDNFESTVRFCKQHVDPKRLLGFLQTIWHPTLEEYRSLHLEAIDQVKQAREWFEGRG